MAGPKDLLTPEQYDRWYKRHRIVEQARQDRIKLEENPIKALPEEERGELPQTWSIAEAFWHKLGCECGSCSCKLSQQIKQVRMGMRPIPPAVKSVVSHLPSLPDRAQPLLRDAVSAFLSSQDEHSKQPGEPD